MYSEFDAIYELLLNNRYKKVKDAFESLDFEIGTTIPCGYGLNITIEPDSVIRKLCNTYEQKKIVNTLFKYCGCLCIAIEIMGINSLGGILYYNNKIGSYLFLIDNVDDGIKNKLRAKVLNKYHIEIIDWDNVFNVFNSYYYSGKLTDFR